VGNILNDLHLLILLVSKLKAMSIPKVSISQIKAARALLNWSQEHLADASQVSLPTIKRLESANGLLGGRPATYEKLIEALLNAGVSFISENGGGPGVRLRKNWNPTVDPS
jgi:transcriptional regulator with XRE-family HTH domain